MWGCDRKADAPVFEVGCSTCNGRDLACQDCDGVGTVPMYQCPSAMIGGARRDTAMQIDLLMRAYMHYEGRHVLPVDGGLLDQSRCFVASCEIIDAERGRLEQMKEAKREREREAAKSRNNMRRHGR